MIHREPFHAIPEVTIGWSFAASWLGNPNRVPLSADLRKIGARFKLHADKDSLNNGAGERHGTRSRHHGDVELGSVIAAAHRHIGHVHRAHYACYRGTRGHRETRSRRTIGRGA